MAQMFAVAQTVLREGNLVAGEQIEIGPERGGDLLHRRAVRAKVAAVPERGGESIGIADEDAVRLACGVNFAAALFGGDVREFVGVPDAFAASVFRGGIFAAVFGHPHGAERGGEIAIRRRARRPVSQTTRAPAVRETPSAESPCLPRSGRGSSSAGSVAEADEAHDQKHRVKHGGERQLAAERRLAAARAVVCTARA